MIPDTIYPIEIERKASFSFRLPHSHHLPLISSWSSRPVFFCFLQQPIASLALHVQIKAAFKVWRIIQNGAETKRLGNCRVEESGGNRQTDESPGHTKCPRSLFTRIPATTRCFATAAVCTKMPTSRNTYPLVESIRKPGPAAKKRRTRDRGRERDKERSGRETVRKRRRGVEKKSCWLLWELCP